VLSARRLTLSAGRQHASPAPRAPSATKATSPGPKTRATRCVGLLSRIEHSIEHAHDKASIARRGFSTQWASPLVVIHRRGTKWARYPQAEIAYRFARRTSPRLFHDSGNFCGVRELLASQGGVIGRSQAAQFGLSPNSMGYRVRAADWQRIHRGVYAPFPGEPTDTWIFARRKRGAEPRGRLPAFSATAGPASAPAVVWRAAPSSAKAGGSPRNRVPSVAQESTALFGERLRRDCGKLKGADGTRVDGLFAGLVQLPLRYDRQSSWRCGRSAGV
jgi:hypothetical protein